jgi:hypothetical protein
VRVLVRYRLPGVQEPCEKSLSIICTRWNKRVGCAGYTSIVAALFSQFYGFGSHFRRV